MGRALLNPDLLDAQPVLALVLSDEAHGYAAEVAGEARPKHGHLVRVRVRCAHYRGFRHSHLPHRARLQRKRASQPFVPELSYQHVHFYP
jgi:hypothetical protein